MNELTKKRAKILPAAWNVHRRKSADILEQNQRVRLAVFIQENTKPITEEWENFAKTLKPAANDMTPLALRDHIKEILSFIVEDMQSFQTRREQAEKSKGKQGRSAVPSAAETHEALRLSGGFNIEQMVSEYRALRASVIKLWTVPNTEMDKTDLADLIRFNECIDQALAESVYHYTKKVDASRAIFLGILGHDLRVPLSAISMSADLMLSMGHLTDRQNMLTSQIKESTERITEIVSGLLDVTRARFGSGLPIIRAPMDMSFVSRQLVDELRTAYPKRTIILVLSGDLKGEWDKARIGQVFTNLISNAIQYSFHDSPIGVTVRGAADAVILSVHNAGKPIPPRKIHAIFDPLTRAYAGRGKQNTGVNLGLGLFITKDIVTSHGGVINVTSSEEDGTTFTARFPRMAPLH
jgi:signal transduction histidine kinase